MISKPIVDGLERELWGRVDVLRLDLLGEVGRAAAGTYGVRLLPTLLVIDGAGAEVARTEGLLTDPGALRDAALAALPD